MNPAQAAHLSGINTATVKRLEDRRQGVTFGHRGERQYLDTRSDSTASARRAHSSVLVCRTRHAVRFAYCPISRNRCSARPGSDTSASATTPPPSSSYNPPLPVQDRRQHRDGPRAVLDQLGVDHLAVALALGVPARALRGGGRLACSRAYQVRDVLRVGEPLRQCTDRLADTRRGDAAAVLGQRLVDGCARFEAVPLHGGQQLADLRLVDGVVSNWRQSRGDWPRVDQPVGVGALHAPPVFHVRLERWVTLAVQACLLNGRQGLAGDGQGAVQPGYGLLARHQVGPLAVVQVLNVPRPIRRRHCLHA